jgi:membrane-associated protease RseP (regulator of RpoE activity)
MTMAFLKAASFALLLLLPAPEPAGDSDEPRVRQEKEIVVDGEPVFTLDEDGRFAIAGDSPIRRGYLGVQLLDITPDLRAFFGAPRDAGVLVAEVEPASPAAKAGLQTGDVILRVDGEGMESSGELSRAVRRKKAGETVKLEIERNKAARNLTATVEERKSKEVDLGDLRQRLRDRGKIADGFPFDLERPLIGRLETLEKLQKKLNDLEKRLGDLEKKLR